MSLLPDSLWPPFVPIAQPPEPLPPPPPFRPPSKCISSSIIPAQRSILSLVSHLLFLGLFHHQLNRSACSSQLLGRPKLAEDSSKMHPGGSCDENSKRFFQDDLNDVFLEALLYCSHLSGRLAASDTSSLPALVCLCHVINPKPSNPKYIWVNVSITSANPLFCIRSGDLLFFGSAPEANMTSCCLMLSKTQSWLRAYLSCSQLEDRGWSSKAVLQRRIPFETSSMNCFAAPIMVPTLSQLWSALVTDKNLLRAFLTCRPVFCLHLEKSSAQDASSCKNDLTGTHCQKVLVQQQSQPMMQQQRCSRGTWTDSRCRPCVLHLIYAGHCISG